ADSHRNDGAASSACREDVRTRRLLRGHRLPEGGRGEQSHREDPKRSHESTSLIGMGRGGTRIGRISADEDKKSKIKQRLGELSSYFFCSLSAEIRPIRVPPCPIF